MKKMPINMNFLKFLTLLSFLSVFSIQVFGFDSIEFAFDEDTPEPGTSTKLPEKIKAMLNYDVRPNRSDFFSRNDLGEAIDLQPEKELGGIWVGTYTLNEKSIKWINSKTPHHEVFNSIEFGDYNFSLKFDVNSIGRIIDLSVAQDGFDYDSINFQRLDDKKLTYWTRAVSKDWVEVIRGKLIRKSKDEILTIFQTTVYKENTPIYSFRGKSSMKKSEQ